MKTKVEHVDMLGKWKVLKDTSLRMEISMVQLLKGARITVKRVNPQHRKVLVDTGSGIDWVSWVWLYDCVKEDL